MLQVDNMDDTIRYYQDILGFKCAARMENEWASVERDDISIMFSCRYGEKVDQKPTMTGSIYIYTNSVDEIWTELKDRAKISYPIETFDYGMKEFAVVDFNGYLLQFGQNINQ